MSLTRERSRDTEDVDRPITVELLTVIEVGDGDLVHDTVSFDLDDIDAAFAELDARYLAGEAAAHAHTWSLVAQAYAAFNRHQLPPTTPDWVNIDHRRGTAFAPGDMTRYIRSGWDLAPERKIYIEAVHRLSDLGAVVTHTAHWTSHEGFDAEWREIAMVTVEGDMFNRGEIFDEADIDAAVARFDELSRPTPRLENAATRTWVRCVDAYNRRDVDGFLAFTTADGLMEDRRKGLRALMEGPAWRKAWRELFRAPSGWRLEMEPVAIRGSRFSLTRERVRDTEGADRPIVVELMTVMEVTDGGLVHDTVSFDPDDLDGAMAELTARWIASGEVAHPEVIETARRLNEAGNRDGWEAFATLNADATFVNHRQLSSPGVQTIADHVPSMRTAASLVPAHRVELAEVLTHSATGLVVHMVLKGTSTEGFAVELAVVALILLDGERVTHLENFDPDQRALALARFEELIVKDPPK